MIQVGDVILSSDLLTEYFCCDPSVCKGQCCVDGDSGAPLTEEEVGEMENVLPAVQDLLSPDALTVIEKQGVAMVDADGDLVTSIVGTQDCVYTFHEGGCCWCAAERRFREGRTSWCKPISCALYPIREKRLSGGLTGLNYHRWSVCASARQKGRELKLPVYRFLKDPLVRRFGAEWYDELEHTVTELKKHCLL